ncbi:MAG: citrate synthase, partial [Anaerolineae bacterium]|nr:citrate synthase [Anaerolineae bacterium]
MTDQAKGLEGVIIAETRLSKVDGQNGRLYYCGYNINDLAAHASFEEVIFLLWNVRLPTQVELDAFKATLFAQSALPDTVLAQMKAFPNNVHPMAALRTAISLVGLFDPQAEDNTPAGNKSKALTLTARMATVIAAWGRIRQGKEPIAPKAGYSLAENFLYMMSGEAPDPTAAEAVDRYLILLADHGMNASTFTARVVTSTDGDMYSAITAAIGSLKGPKHGGANEAAMRMFVEAAESGLPVAEWFKQARANDRRLMGIGHRVYKA